jgi:hypothetical protein
MKKLRWDLIGIIGGIGGVLFGVFAVLRSGDPEKVQIAVAMVVVFGAMGFLLYKFLWQPRFNVRRLQKDGIPGKAKILEVIETNITVNNNPQIKLVMELKNKSGEFYNAQCKTVVSRKSPVFFQPGKEVKVKIDPDNEKNVIIDL